MSQSCAFLKNGGAVTDRTFCLEAFSSGAAQCQNSWQIYQVKCTSHSSGIKIIWKKICGIAMNRKKAWLICTQARKVRDLTCSGQCHTTNTHVTAKNNLTMKWQVADCHHPASNYETQRFYFCQSHMNVGPQRKSLLYKDSLSFMQIHLAKNECLWEIYVT